MKRRIVVWGTGFVGRLVIPEIVKHPAFELVGVGVSDPAKAGRDVGDILAELGPSVLHLHVHTRGMGRMIDTLE